MEQIVVTMITVYTTGDACMQCRMTKDVMDAEGLRYAAFDLTDPANASAREYVTEELGYSSAPVVVVDDHHHWTGFQPDRIKQLASRLDVSPAAEQD
ncbi:glutaredoxin family protein [Microbacterium sp. 2FI]|uniref:glutaredoxin family protein n=1 Tax=Microbacterium sp. 2FI TaxID=2502193 RepID=UPI002017FD3B|nr:glutaredoxin family protein [Microbacterium sp. 2FI]